MSKQNYRIAVVGASSLLGREIAEELGSGPLASASVLLLDSEQEGAGLDQVGAEAVLIQSVEPAAFEGVDVAIFASRKDAELHLGTARGLGAMVVDASGALAGDRTGIPVRSPAILETNASPLDLETSAIAAAHPVTTMLAGALRRVGKRAAVRQAFATVLQPASENGGAALDEMHGQTVSLLSFQPVAKNAFDAQAAFNLLPRFGDEATAILGETRERVAVQLKALLGEGVALPLMQWVQAPVFHGFAVSLFLELEKAVAVSEIESALDGDLFELFRDDDEPASNVSVAGSGRVYVEVRAAEASGDGTRFAVWMVADNLKLMAQTAVGAAAELTRLRPLGKVQ